MDFIGELKRLFTYSNGKLYWACTHLKGKEAGHLRRSGYIQVRVTIGGVQRNLLTHRIIFAIHNGYFPDLVDHIDRNPENNLIDNLREANKSINAINTGIRSNNKSGCKGVSLYKDINKWVSAITIGGERKYLGAYTNIEDAITARKKGEEVYHKVSKNLLKKRIN